LIIALAFPLLFGEQCATSEEKLTMEIIRTPYAVVYKEAAGFKDVYGGAGGMVFAECMRIVPAGSTSRRAIVFTHPVGGGAFLPLVSALAKAGHHIIYVNPRYRGNDSALIMEKCIADLGAALRDAKTRWGYDEIILGGWSGGGSMSLFYQDQAERPTITHTPAGDAYDMTAMELPTVAGIMLLAAHISRAVTLTEWMDPSIADESRPMIRPIPTSRLIRPVMSSGSARPKLPVTGESRPGSRPNWRAFARTRNAPLSCMARWRTFAGPTQRKTRLTGGRMNAIWAIRALPMTGR
jgi:pimeloyl-ACP methyl ester carboxylesterase